MGRGSRPGRVATALARPRSIAMKPRRVITLLVGPAALVGLLAAAGGVVPAAPVPKGGLPPAGVFVLDDCDPVYKGKAAYEDNLSAIDPSGKLVFRVSGLNGCQSIGSSHLVANDPARNRVWALEIVGHRVRQ